MPMPIKFLYALERGWFGVSKGAQGGEERCRDIS